MGRNLLRRVFAAAGYYAMHLSRRDPRLWVFGNLKGFRDNPRYLAEYLVRTYPDLSVWWVARTEHEAEKARAAGIRAVMRGSDAAAAVQRRAGVAFLCHDGFQDLQPVWLGGAYLVNLSHGTPLKRVALDHDIAPLMGGSRLARLFARIHLWSLARRLAQFDLIVAPGELAATRFASSFGGSPERVKVLGVPRFDILLGGTTEVGCDDLREKLGVRTQDHLALWLPTWRDWGDASWLPRLESSELDKLLADTSIVLVVKPHPLSNQAIYRERLPAQHPRVRLLAEDDYDVNCLLRAADSLITDYSSAAFDYAILQRPIYFLAPDIEEYGKGRDLYTPFKTVTGDRHHLAWHSLFAELRTALLSTGGPPSSLDSAATVASLTKNNDEYGSCERITRYVAGAVHIHLAT
jgi:CDP-glycerol glycerophosphotransferase